MEINRFFTNIFTGGLLLLLVNGPSLATEPEHPIPYDDEADLWDVPYGELDQWGKLYDQAGQWVLLGDNLVSQANQFVSNPSLITNRKGHPIIAFSTQDRTSYQQQTYVMRWSHKHMTWINIGQPLETFGPAIGIDNRQRIHLCTGDRGPFAWRWNGSDWVNLGGNISVETDYQGRRYSVYDCADIALDNTNTPIVSWSADVGAKANIPLVARWNKRQQKWLGLGRAIGGRSFAIDIDIDIRNRLYLVTRKPGGSYGGRNTSRFWRRDGELWTQLGTDMLHTLDPVIATNKNKPYIALTEKSSGMIKFMRWQQDDWEELASPGLGHRPQLDFTLTGKPIMAYLTTDDMNNQFIRVKQFVHGAWQNVGDTVVQTADNIQIWLVMAVDTRGRPTVAWTEEDYAANQTQLFVKRYQRIYD